MIFPSVPTFNNLPFYGNGSFFVSVSATPTPPLSAYTFIRSDGISVFYRPDGLSQYIRP